MKSDDYAPGR